MNYDKSCSILLLGDLAVGKTSLIARYTNGIFNETYISTVGIENLLKQEIINNENVLVKIWDTVGQERFRAITPSILRNAEGVIIVFDVTSKDSFENIKEWINTLKINVGDNTNSIPVIIVGNKIDKEDEREIEKNDALKFAEDNKYKYFETSAKTGEGVDDAFRDMARQILIYQSQFKEERETIKINKDKKDDKNKKGCC